MLQMQLPAYTFCIALKPRKRCTLSTRKIGYELELYVQAGKMLLVFLSLYALIGSVEQARRESQLRYVVIYGAACSYCLSRAQRLDGSYLRTFALELKE
jgi:hypothetical protein